VEGNGDVISAGKPMRVSLQRYGADVPVSATYYSSLSSSGHRMDHSDRPELLHGSVDFPVPKPYWALQPALDPVLDQPETGASLTSAADSLASTATDLLGGLSASLGQTPVATRGNSPAPGYKEKEAERKKEEQRLRRPGPINRVFVLDVSEGSVRRGVVRYVCEGIRRGLYGSKRQAEGMEGEGEDEDTIAGGERIAIITVAETVGFWNLSVRGTVDNSSCSARLVWPKSHGSLRSRRCVCTFPYWLFGRSNRV
jgi:protein transport protein SEC24